MFQGFWSVCKCVLSIKISFMQKKKKKNKKIIKKKTKKKKKTTHDCPLRRGIKIFCEGPNAGVKTCLCKIKADNSFPRCSVYKIIIFIYI
jgi:hypothetical protein